MVAHQHAMAHQLQNTDLAVCTDWPAVRQANCVCTTQICSCNYVQYISHMLTTICIRLCVMHSTYDYNYMHVLLSSTRCHALTCSAAYSIRLYVAVISGTYHCIISALHYHLLTSLWHQNRVCWIMALCFTSLNLSGHLWVSNLGNHVWIQCQNKSENLYLKKIILCHKVLLWCQISMVPRAESSLDLSPASILQHFSQSG
jgi:hypothetical protein